MNRRGFHKRGRPTGQALVLIVLMFLGLLLFLGLMLDLGQIFLAKAYLRKTADAASLAAAAQFREGRGPAEMAAAAHEVSRLNNINPTSILVETCITNPGDPEVCQDSGGVPRKLVRVTIDLRYPLTFLSLIDIDFVDLTEVSVGEAASLDLVLVLDVSESMSWDGTTPASRDPEVCNADNSCKPFDKVKSSAIKFAEKILGETTNPNEEDRLAIVTFANGWQGGEKGTVRLALGTEGWTRDIVAARAAINNLKIYNPGVVCPAFPNLGVLEPCRLYDGGGNFVGVFMTNIDDNQPPPWFGNNAVSTLGTTNMGGGLLLAGGQFSKEKRPEALWVVVVLTDGAVNATFPTKEDIDLIGDEVVITVPSAPPDIGILKENLPLGYCPNGTWIDSGDWTNPNEPHRMICQDGSAISYNPPSGSYDASDFTRDQAKFVACAATNPSDSCQTIPGTYIEGVGAVVFTIGLGNAILAEDTTGTPYGGYMLRWIAALGDDGDASTNPCADVAFASDYTKSCGHYYYAQLSTDLDRVFELIASRIFTRLTQ